MRSWLIIGGVLTLLLSLPTVFLQATEAFLEHQVYARYGIDLLPEEKVANIDGSQVTVKVASLHQEVDSASQLAPVLVTVNGQDYSLSTPCHVGSGGNVSRYYRSVALAMLTDRKVGKKYLSVVEGFGSLLSKSWCYNILSVSKGSTKLEHFAYEDRAAASYRIPLIRLVGPPVGFHSGLLQLMPTWWYPILYPWLTLLLGATASVVGYRRRRNLGQRLGQRFG
jgi:hypothetical protein